MERKINYNHCIMETVETEEIVCLHSEAIASKSFPILNTMSSSLPTPHSYNMMDF